MAISDIAKSKGNFASHFVLLVLCMPNVCLKHLPKTALLCNNKVAEALMF